MEISESLLNYRAKNNPQKTVEKLNVMKYGLICWKMKKQSQ